MPPTHGLRLIPAVIVGLGLLTAAAPPGATSLVDAQSDLDAFMQQVLTRRDDNWKKLQQYILDEHEQIELRGPNRQPVWGKQREYRWYIRDGFFVRSPLEFDGVAIGDSDRRKYESEFLRRERRREERWRGNQAAGSETGSASKSPEVASTDLTTPGVDGLLRQTRQPEFISSAYFLRFKFEEGKYALVGRERLDGREVLRVEYYPTKLYSQEQVRRQAHSHDKNDPWDAEMQRMLNKVALVTLWVEPASHQIVKYTFDNVGFDFLPAQWLVRIGNVRAWMTMGQPFPDVWLPRGLEMSVAFTLAVGPFDLRYALDYHDYKLADVTSKVAVPGGR